MEYRLILNKSQSFTGLNRNTISTAATNSVGLSSPEPSFYGYTFTVNPGNPNLANPKFRIIRKESVTGIIKIPLAV